MSAQRYERVAANEDDDERISTSRPTIIPNSPPPSFHSRASSRRPSNDHHVRSAEEQNLNDAFDAPSDDESDGEDAQDQRHLISGAGNTPQSAEISDETPTSRPHTSQRSVTQLPIAPSIRPSAGRPQGNGPTNDGVFANLNAKPRVGDEVDEKPPTYEQAAADATPPYWETTVLSPYATTGNPDDVFVDGLLVGSFFSFVWNALISMSFQLIGFLLTYLLHTTHAAKHGSRAGLGITLVQYGFQMRYAASKDASEPSSPSAPVDGVPDDPNSHNFDPDTVTGNDHSGGMSKSDWLSFALMIVGWFILIRAASDYMRARRQEALVRSSPDRGLGVAVVAEGEQPEHSV